MSGPRWNKTDRTQTTRVVDGTEVVASGPGCWLIPGTPFAAWHNETESVWVLCRVDGDGKAVEEVEYARSLTSAVRLARALAAPVVS